MQRHHKTQGYSTGPDHRLDIFCFFLWSFFTTGSDREFYSAGDCSWHCG